MKKNLLLTLGTTVCSFFLAGQIALADSVDPASFSATLGIGESTTIRKTVTIDDASPTSGVLDVMFVFDTSGSMGSVINGAKAAAGDILIGLSGFGDLASGVGYYSEPGPGPGHPDAIVQDLSTNAATTDSSINTKIFLGLGGGGGDFPEEGIRSVTEVADRTTWRPGSHRVIIALGDATWKESDGFTEAGAATALANSGATLIGINYGSMTSSYGIDPTALAVGSGGSIITGSGLEIDDLVNDIIAGVTASFENYSTVSLSDLGAGLPGVAVSVAAVGADAVGDSFVGSYDRSTERTFEFDVTFKGLEEGLHEFETLALVDDGIVARELDKITVAASSVPEPSSMLLMGTGLLGLVGVRRKKTK